MKVLPVLCLVIALAGYAIAQHHPAASASEPHSQSILKTPLLVTPAWLAGHLSDPDVVLLHIGFTRRAYENEHIAGARYLWYGWLAAPTPEMTNELLPVDSIKAALERLGVSNSSRIVLYAVGNQVTAAARIYFTLDYIGLGAQTSILDGGMGAWTAAGYPTTSDVPPPMMGSLTLNVHPDRLRLADWMNANTATPGIAIVDARASDFYKGTAPGTVRGGHIPGAVNIPYSSLLDSTNAFKHPDSLRAIFTAAGIKPGDHVASYCHSGSQACIVYMAAKQLGYDASMFDGSWDEWSVRKEFPVIAAPAKKDSTMK